MKILAVSQIRLEKSNPAQWFNQFSLVQFRTSDMGGRDIDKRVFTERGINPPSGTDR